MVDPRPEDGVILDTEGIAAILKSGTVARLVNEAANRIAAASPSSARVAQYTTDRAAATVSVRDSEKSFAELAGELTVAAGSIGVQVTQRG